MVLIALGVYFGLSGIQAPFTIPFSYTFLSFVLVMVPAIAVSYVSAKSYLLDGSGTILVLGSAVLLFGMSTFGASIVLDMRHSNVYVAFVYYTGVMTSSLLHFISASANTADYALHTKPNWLYIVVAYGGSAAIILLSVVVAPYSGLPFELASAFMLDEVLYAAVGVIILFAVSAFLFMRQYLIHRIDILYWYALALALIAVGEALQIFITSVQSPLNWIARASIYAAGLYFIAAVASCYRRR